MRKLLFSIIFGLCVLIGCSSLNTPLKSQHFYPLGKEEIISMLSAANLSAISMSIGDKSYSCPTKNWVEKDFADSYLKFTWDLGLKGRYLDESMDCEDISQGAAFWAKYLHWKETKEKRGLAFGEIHYFKTGYGWHALNIIIVQNGDKKEVVFFEPQKRFLVSLSDKERATCIFIRF